ncbi:hypothetical protein DSO57_1035669 [Entomophthora muscae]|uniref:Uncharacterized protein n=1 Tax=Entomophthora muscae TaxID=34485 RepID=A0ACC2RQC9_9FUNG|nr:hypothetical protein DSO57_1035669 [Entomophthora muscae]
MGSDSHPMFLVHLLLVLGGIQGKVVDQALTQQLAHVYIKSVYRCAGILVRPNYVLTVASHVVAYPHHAHVSLYSGSNFTQRDASARFRITEAHFHPDYTFNSPYESSLVLLKLDLPKGQPLSGNRFTSSSSFTSATLVGWEARQTRELGEHEALVAHTIDLETKCGGFTKPPFLATELCGTTNEKSAHYIAEGSPLLLQTPKGPRIVATYSRAFFQTSPVQLTFVKLAPFTSWIKQETRPSPH